ncbi:MAG TPA: hypothetical protein VLC98_18020 [Phnomibacter sp.]|nr:hypothetical protein [Phnomibacter sp.]
MKKLLMCLLVLPALLYGQAKQDVLIVGRLMPKFDKIDAFEKALANHNKKFHTTAPFKVTVFFVNTGLDAGSYQMSMGPVSWEEIDKRVPGDAHDADWKNNVLPLVQKVSNDSYLMYKPDMSTIGFNDFAEKASIARYYYKPGCGPKTEEIFKGLKQYWEKDGATIAVYQTNSSGDPAFNLVFRHKQGWKEKAEGFHKSMKELMGESAYNKFLENMNAIIDHVTGETIYMRKDLSSN